MKNIARIFILLTAVVALTACNKEKEIEAKVQQNERVRDITYTVGGQTTTVHLKTEAEWDALLDRFCDYAQGGDTVTFHNIHTTASQQTKETVNFSTTDREEMKRWMAQMENEGKTVTVNYDPNTHTWHGEAYTTAQQPQTQRPCYTGVLVSISDEYWWGYGEPPYPFWALKINEDTTILTSKRTNTPFTIGDEVYQEGDTVTICGYIYAMYNYDYTQINYYFSSSPREDRLWRPYAVYFNESNEGLLMITVDDDNHKLYCTSTHNDITWQGSLGGGVFSYAEIGMEDNLGNPIIIVYNDATQAPGVRFSIEHRSNGAIILHDLDGANMPNNGTPGQLWLNVSFTSCWHTWVCDTMGFNIVIHYDAMPLIKYPPHGYSSSPFYANCTTPFEIGLFSGYFERYGSSITYEATEHSIMLNGLDHDITVIGEPDGCLDNYVFHMIERPY